MESYLRWFIVVIAFAFAGNAWFVDRDQTNDDLTVATYNGASPFSGPPNNPTSQTTPVRPLTMVQR
jgi:hypothetical protein